MTQRSPDTLTFRLCGLPRSWTLMIFPIDRRRKVPQDSCWGAKFKCFVFGNPYKLGVFFHLGEWSFPTFCYPRVTISWPSRGPFVDSRYLGDAVKMTLEAFNADDLTRDEYFDQSFGEGGYAKGKGIQDILLLYNLLLRCSVYSHFTRSYGRAQWCFVWTPEASYPLRMRVAIKCWALTCQCSTKKQEPFNLPACFDERFLGYIIYIYIYLCGACCWKPECTLRQGEEAELDVTKQTTLRSWNMTAIPGVALPPNRPFVSTKKSVWRSVLWRVFGSCYV